MARPGVLDVLRRPLVVAPMAGSPSTSDLVIAAAGAGALGFLAAGYKTPAAMAAEIAAVRAGTAGPFGVNVFVPGAPSADAEAIAGYLDSLRADAGAAGASLAEAAWDDDGFEEKVAALLADPPAAWSIGSSSATPMPRRPTRRSTTPPGPCAPRPPPGATRSR
jgi:nitronate monooxygenase